MKDKEKSVYRAKYIDEYEELMLKMATASFVEREGKRLEEEKRGTQKDKQYQPSLEALNKFKRGLNKHNRFNFLRNYKHTFSSIGTKVLVMAGCVVIVFLGAFTTVEAFRIKVINFVITSTEEYSKFVVEDSGIGGGMAPKGWEDRYYPHYIPQGYEITGTSLGNKVSDIIYRNEKNEKIIYTMDTLDQEIILDTENAEYREIVIQGNKAYLYSKEGYSTIIYHNSDYIFSIVGDPSEEEMIKIAESIKKSK